MLWITQLLPESRGCLSIAPVLHRKRAHAVIKPQGFGALERTLLLGLPEAQQV